MIIQAWIEADCQRCNNVVSVCGALHYSSSHHNFHHHRPSVADVFTCHFLLAAAAAAFDAFFSSRFFLDASAAACCFPLSEKDAKLAQKLGQLQPLTAVFPQEGMGQLAPFGPT